MPYAWHHTTSLSSDGYASPDTGEFTFIGFEGKAPYLTYDGLGATDAGYYFLRNFYYAALYLGYYYSVNAALDYAAQMVWGTSFANCILRTGFTIANETGKMKVYGNGNNHISSYAGGGGGCPILYVWNGEEYFCEGLLDIHNPEGTDVIYSHTLVTMPERVHGAYLFRLVEHPQTISHIDQVKLYAILKDKSLLELPLIYAWHSEYGNVLPQLLFSDDWRVDEYGANWNNGTSQSIDLKFAALSPNIEIMGFIFQIEGYNIIAKM
jgi:hypothetical protein